MRSIITEGVNQGQRDENIIRQAIRGRDPSAIIDQIRRDEQGLDGLLKRRVISQGYLDVNFLFDTKGEDRTQGSKWLLEVVNQSTDLPLCLDTDFPDLLGTVLEHFYLLKSGIEFDDETSVWDVGQIPTLKDHELPVLNSIRLDINTKTLYHWVRMYKKEHNIPNANATSSTSNESAEEELKRLRRENKILKQERDILKKATAYFAKETL